MGRYLVQISSVSLWESRKRSEKRKVVCYYFKYTYLTLLVNTEGTWKSVQLGLIGTQLGLIGTELE